MQLIHVYIIDIPGALKKTNYSLLQHYSHPTEASESELERKKRVHVNLHYTQKQMGGSPEDRQSFGVLEARAHGLFKGPGT